MAIAEEVLKNLIDITENLMKDCKIEIRDTWKGLDGYNYDNYFKNGKKFNGELRLELEDEHTGNSEFKGKKYNISDKTSFAYDCPKIFIPDRLKGLSHPIVHELVHYIQLNNDELEKKYIKYDGTNYFQYVSQKVELEAHFIQLLYIARFEFQLLGDNANELREFIEKGVKDEQKRIQIILVCKSKKII